MSCKTCAHLGVDPDKAGRVVVRHGNAYECKAPDPALPPLPYSITKAYGLRWPPSRNYVTGADGENCPVYVRRVKEKT